jgi:ribosomal protein L11 methyltransferase
MSGRADRRRRWGVVRVEAPDRLADELAGSIGGQALGIEVESVGPDRAALSIYLETEDEARAASARVRRVLKALVGSGEAPGEPIVETVDDDRWVERYQERLRPLPLGAGFVVLPPDAEEPPDAGRTVIRMVAGRAFGTGEHATTRLCAALLEQKVSPGSLWVDVGTGSGILAIVAARCGARRVAAVDVDPDAIEVAREWVALNGVAATVDLLASGIAPLSVFAADGVVVNISGAYLERDAGALAKMLRPGGELIASGFPAAELDDVSRLLRAAGLRETTRSETEGWACIAMRREPGATPWGG